MMKLLFSSEGRISSPEFIRGAVILIAVNFVMWLSWFGGLFLGFIATLIALFSIYCWACLFIKRFHDAGKSGWYFWLVLVVFLILVLWVLPSVTIAIFPISEEAIQAMIVIQEFQELEQQPTTMEELTPVIEAMNVVLRQRAIPGSIVYFLGGVIVAFGTNALLKSDPEPNRWG